MVRFLVLSQRPADIPAFERHSIDVHGPLATKLPELRNYAVSRNVTAVRGPGVQSIILELETL